MILVPDINIHDLLRPIYFITFSGDIFRGFQIGGPKWFFGQFVFDVASVTCNCPLMSGRASGYRLLHALKSSSAQVR